MILADTNVFTRTIEHGHIHQQPAINAMRLLRTQHKEKICIAPQVLIEFYSVSTRSTNTLHLSPDDALREIAIIKARCPLLEETPELFIRWESLVAKYKPVNRCVFDTRLVAFMLVHNIPRILSFNDKDFAGYTEIQVLNPFDVLGIPRV